MSGWVCAACIMPSVFAIHCAQPSIRFSALVVRTRNTPFFDWRVARSVTYSAYRLTSFMMNPKAERFLADLYTRPTFTTNATSLAFEHFGR